MTGSTRKKTDVLSPTLSQCTLSELATRPLVLVILVRRLGDVLATRPHGDTRYTLTLQCSVLASRPLVLLMVHSRSSMRRVRHEAAWAADTALSHVGVRALHEAAVPLLRLSRFSCAAC